MHKILKIKLMMLLLAMSLIGGISIKNLPLIHNTYTAIKKLQNYNIREDSLNDVVMDFQNTYKDDVDKDLSLSEIENDDQNNPSDNSKYKSDKKKKKKTTTSNLEMANNNVTNKPTNTSPQLEETSSNANTKNQTVKDDALDVKMTTINYDRTTFIYDNDDITLLRIEYYVNNKLTYYSVIEHFDTLTKSYIEKIYKCNLETNDDPLIRTDVYVNGDLTNSY